MQDGRGENTMQGKFAWLVLMREKSSWKVEKKNRVNHEVFLNSSGKGLCSGSEDNAPLGSGKWILLSSLVH